MNISRPRLLVPLVLSAAASMPSFKVDLANDPQGNQPHGHSSSQGSTSNLKSKAAKKKARKAARKARKRNR